jgi:DNA-directed RNA polymerase specialized sigma24 family protein
MSATVLAQLYAVADTSGIPPGVPSEFEIECAPTDLVEVDVIVEDAAQENSAAAVDQSTMLPDTHAPGADPDLWLYRKRTVGLLRRYMRLSIEVGRMPSLLGREFFRTRVTSYRAATFEDAVIFVHDVERSLEKLSDFDKKVIAKTVLQEYPQEEAARLIGCGQRHLARCYVEALDRVSEIFLKRRLLLRLPCVKSEAKKSCQGGKADEFDLSDSEQTENKY